MKNRGLVLCAVLSSLVVAAIVMFIFSSQSVEGQQKTLQRYSEVPEIISNVKTLEVVEADLKKEGTTDAFVKIKIKNNSDKPIMAITFETRLTSAQKHFCCRQTRK